jgi:hypothetical protein
MIPVFIVISNNGDGSNSLFYFDGRRTAIEELIELDKDGDCEMWASGDGVQISRIMVTDSFLEDNPNLEFTNIEDILGVE